MPTTTGTISTGITDTDLTAVTLTILGAVIFFFASAGASAAYLSAIAIG